MSNNNKRVKQLSQEELAAIITTGIKGLLRQPHIEIGQAIHEAMKVYDARERELQDALKTPQQDSPATRSVRGESDAN